MAHCVRRPEFRVAFLKDWRVTEEQPRAHRKADAAASHLSLLLHLPGVQLPSTATKRSASPVVQSAVAQPRHRQACHGIRKSACYLFVDIDPETRGIVNHQMPVFEPVVHLKHVMHD